MNKTWGFMESFSIMSPGGGRAGRRAGSTVGPARWGESKRLTGNVLLNKWYTPPYIYSEGCLFTQACKGNSNEDTRSFDLYWIVIIGLNGMISKLLCLDFLEPIYIQKTLPAVNFSIFVINPPVLFVSPTLLWCSRSNDWSVLTVSEHGSHEKKTQWMYKV